MAYCSLADAKAIMKAGSTVDDSIMLMLIDAASQRIDLQMGGIGPFFEPYNEAREYELRFDNVDSGRNLFILPSGEPMLSVSGATISGSGAAAVSAFPSARTPVAMLRRTDGGTWYAASGDEPPTVTISGVWGYHRRYTHAWAEVDALAAGINASVTALTVADADGADEDGAMPRFSPGQLIRLDSEWLRVLAVNTGTNVLTVRRGENGSTAAAHLIAAPVAVWRTEEPVRRACARQAGMLYARMGAYEQQTITDVGTVTYPADLLIELRGVLQGYQYL